jgi:hypothetical protein
VIKNPPNSRKLGAGNSGLAAAFACLLLAGACSSKTSSGTPGSGTGGDGQGNGGTGSGTGGGSGPTGTGGAGTGTGGASATGGGGVGGGGVDAGAGGAAGFGIGLGGAGGAAPTCQDPQAVTGTAATVAVNLGMTRATVGADLMGVYTAVYDGNMQNPSTPGWLKAAGVKSLRYPGGSYSDLYHWSTHTANTFVANNAAPFMPTISPGSDFGSFVGLLDRVGAHAMITVNYGSNTAGDGPGAPQEAAAWVAYANGSATDTKAIGMDASGVDWHTVGYWASLRGAAPLAVDDGYNILRISHPAPVGIKYWEVGNELYGNGFYYAYEWEEDLHSSHSVGRLGNAGIAPSVYGSNFPAFSAAMKAVDPTVKVGAIVHWPYTEFLSPNWNTSVLTSPTCTSMDFAIDHWYPGTGLVDLLTRPTVDIPMMFSQLHGTMNTLCGAAGMTMPIAITEWGPNFLAAEIMAVNAVTPAVASTQTFGVFAADAYANFMEQGALAVHWLEMHADGFLGASGVDTPSYAYHGTLMASLFAIAGDTIVQATTSNTGALGTLLKAHGAKHADGSVAVMLVNTSPTLAAAVTVNVAGLATGATLPCVGTQYGYAPVDQDADGTPTRAPIFSKNNSVLVSVPAHGVVDVVFPGP